MRNISITSLAVSMRPAALMRGAIRNATCAVVDGTRPLKAGHVQQRAQPRIAHRRQPVQPVLHDDAILARQRHHVRHRADRHQLQERFDDARAPSPAASPSVASSACTSLNATPTPHRFFSG